jgi:hypothetical protein
MNVNLVWVPGHRDIPRNCEADELARNGTMLPDTSLNKYPGVSFANCKLLLKEDILKKGQS